MCWVTISYSTAPADWAKDSFVGYSNEGFSKGYYEFFVNGMPPREGRGGQFPYPSGRRMKVKATHTPCNLLDKERNPDHSGIVTGWNSGRRRKSNDWPIDL